MDLWPSLSPHEFNEQARALSEQRPASSASAIMPGVSAATVRPRAWRCLLLALTIATAAARPPTASAQPAPAADSTSPAPAATSVSTATPPGTGSGPAGVAPTPAGDPPVPSAAPDATVLNAGDPVRYRVAIEAPGPVTEAITSAVDLVRWQNFEGMTEDLFDRLARDAVTQAREAAATQGYFSATVEITVNRATTPVTVRLGVTPGPLTTIGDVKIVVDGPANDTPQGLAAITRLRDQWLLPKGEPFHQEKWTSAKQRAVATLAASPYAAARLAASEALVNPPLRTADLSVTLDSGPAFTIGQIDIQGLKRYGPDLVQNFANVRAGDLYSGQSLDDYVRRLLASGYFASVQAAIDPDAARADNARVTISVIEAPPRRLELGLGYSTDTEYRASATYSDMNVDGAGMQMYTGLRLESLVQQLDVRFVLPPRPGGWIDTYATGAQRTDIENLVTRTAAVTWRRRLVDERRTPAFGMGYYVNDQRPSGQPTVSSHALFIDGEYTWRNVDDLLDPTKGWMANVQVGWGVPGVSTEQFGRVIGKLVGWWPLTRKDALVGRAEAGAVIAPSREGIPSVFLFRTGGDTTVRGYAYENLGVQQGDAVVGGRYYALASAEYNHWITPSLGLAAFVDVGNAKDEISGFDFALGYGVGGRLRTPIGPFRLDVAYGQDDHSLRLHFSVGLAF